MLDERDQHVDGLRHRKPMVEVRELYEQGAYLDAVAVFQRYFFGKLRGPGDFGLSPLDAEPVPARGGR